jgi:hypothetical protein
MNHKHHLAIGAAAAALVGLVVYARSSAGAKSTNTLVRWTRTQLVKVGATQATAKVAAPVAVTDSTAVLAANTPDSPDEDYEA